MKICFYASKAVNENKTRIYPEGSLFQARPPVLLPNFNKFIGNKSINWQNLFFMQRSIVFFLFFKIKFT